MAQITKRGATQSIFDKTALQELLPFDRITRNAMLVLCPFMGAHGLSGGHWVKAIVYTAKRAKYVKFGRQDQILVSFIFVIFDIFSFT